MKKQLKVNFLIAAFIMLASAAHAQYYFYDDQYLDNNAIFEAGGSVGFMNCLTDIGGQKGPGQKFFKDLNFGQTQPNASLYLGMLYNYCYGIRLEASYGMVGASDSILKSAKGTPSDTRYDRNLSFRSKISEISIIGELYPVDIFRKYNPDVFPSRISPYFMVGIGLFHFNPQAMYRGQWVDLQPLKLEGQGFKETGRPDYKLTEINFPVGVGVKYELSAHTCIRAEFLYRVLNTDYLDDCSTTYIDPALFQKYLTGKQLEEALALNYRGNEIGKDHDHNPGAPRGRANNNDAYFSFNFKFAYIFGREKNKYSGY